MTKQLQEVQKEVKSLKNNISETVDKTIISTVKQQEKKWAEVM